jgi:molybdenum cofactor cytidylyltransferase
MSTAPDSHAAVVLAAGGSRRLGQAKQLLKRDGETLVHRAARLAEATHPERLLLVCGGYADAVRATVADLQVEIVFNHDWEAGLASSLRVAADALQGGHSPVLIVGCDQPALEAAHLQRLLHGATTVASGCAATSHRDARGIPAVVSALLLRQARDLHGDQGLRGVLQQLPRESVYLLDAPELQLDIDTSENVERAIIAGLLDPMANQNA